MALLLLLVGSILAPAASGAQGDDLLASLKVAYIYNFTHFIEWPDFPADRLFVICVIGDEGMERQLRTLEHQARRVDDRPIEIRVPESLDDLDACRILFVGARAAHQLQAVVERTAGEPVLLVGDAPGYAGRGVAIELFRKPDIFGRTERLRFRIDPKALQGRGLGVSAQLYDVAEVIE